VPPANILFAFAAFLIGIVALLSALLSARHPRFRIKWRGTTRVVSPLSCVGFAIFFISGGFAPLLRHGIPGSAGIIIFICAMGGWITIAIGEVFAARRRAGDSFRLPDEPRVRTLAEKHAWLMAAFGLVFLILFLSLILSKQ
jgi:hypothetical protein